MKPVESECPLCGTYLPSIGHLISEHGAAKARLNANTAGPMTEAILWADLFAVEHAINAKNAAHLISTTYDDGR